MTWTVDEKRPRLVGPFAVHYMKAAGGNEGGHEIRGLPDDVRGGVYPGGTTSGQNIISEALTASETGVSDHHAITRFVVGRLALAGLAWSIEQPEPATLEGWLDRWLYGTDGGAVELLRDLHEAGWQIVRLEDS